jgi:hypothetical protein
VKFEASGFGGCGELHQSSMRPGQPTRARMSFKKQIKQLAIPKNRTFALLEHWRWAGNCFTPNQL